MNIYYKQPSKNVILLYHYKNTCKVGCIINTFSNSISPSPLSSPRWGEERVRGWERVRGTEERYSQ
ncbi:MAG: hypothetical protein NC824_03295 [Candidatus Omnitrophica bacterium]|nr:hypothetical protein [Candidatus Omnitrophota bacterium]